MDRHRLFGHLLALGTCIVWGTTFISTKVLLSVFLPVEILLFRFAVAWFVLFLLSPRLRPPKSLKDELPFIGAGLTGLTLYALLEATALSYTMASNVGIIVSAAPMFTALFLWLFGRGGQLRLSFWLGFAVAMSGITLLTLSGGEILEFSPLGDLLTLLAAMVWGLYALFVARTADSGYTQLQATRRIFFWGFLFTTIPAAVLIRRPFDPSVFSRPVVLFNLLYLAVVASAGCFLSWNSAMRLIGPVSTSVYIYLIPVITLVSSALILKEPVTPAAAGAIALILLGLWLSQHRAPNVPAPDEAEAVHTE